MAKKGKEYEKLVAAIAGGLYPDASVRTGVWVTGPDGRREVDVEVRGTVDGRAEFTLIECKDWKPPVDIQEIDKLASKREDLQADRSVIVSNSGFTAAALRKCERVGIQAASALKEADNLIRITFYYEYFQKFLSVDDWRLMLHFAVPPVPDEGIGVPISEWKYKGLPLLNWISGYSKHLLGRYEDATTISVDCTFGQPEYFEWRGSRFLVRGMSLLFMCSKRWACQNARHSVSLGLFDHIERRLIVPEGETFNIALESDGWKEIVEAPENAEMSSGDVRFESTALAPVSYADRSGVPPLTEAIYGCRVRTSALPAQHTHRRPLRLQTTA